MVDDWKLVKLGDLVDITHGYAFKGEFFCDEPKADILLTPGNFAIGGGFKNDKFKYYVGDIPKDYILKEGDLIVTMTDLSKSADTLGYPAIIPKSPKNCNFLHNQRLGKVIINNNSQVDKYFLYYQLRTNDYRSEILASATGSTVKHSSPNRIKEYSFFLPPLSEQKAIAHILGTLDDKIELNQRMNRTLEDIARAIFKSWFIDFDPVRAKMEGRQPEGMSKEVADLFCDSFVDSQLGMIPKGWRVAKLFELGKIITGKTPSTKIPEYFGGDIPFITPSDMDGRKIIRKTTRYLTKTGANAVKSAQIPAESVLVSCIGSDMGKVTCAASNSVTNQQINSIIVDKKYSKEYVYYDLSGRKYELINLAGGGSAVPILNKNHFSMINILLPLEKLMQAFEQNAHLISIKIDESDKQAETLTNIRDSLLPKLISGEIRVKEAEKIVEKEV